MSARDEITSRIRNMVHAVLEEEGGTAAVAYRTLDGDLADPNEWSVPSYPEPADMLAAITVANTVAGQAHGLVHDYLAKARGTGRTWREIADALSIDPEEDERAHKAFLIAAGTPSQPYDDRYASWRCASCREWIRDNGPYSGHPAEAETGHAETCERHRAEITEYEKRWTD